MTESYEFLFNSGPFGKKPGSIYRAIPRPDWFNGDYSIVGAKVPEGSWETFNYPQYEVYEHIAACRYAREKGKQKELRLAYTNFPTFEPRIRELRAYMDSCRPTGFRQLWRDKRDSLNYYTFWGVIIFGFTSVLLALLSLAVSTAQTVASFKALESTST